MLLRFTKMHGLGNDFVVCDAVTQDINLNSEHIRQLASRHTGIGCDQVLLVEPPTTADVDFNYRIFNSDGGEVEQCGNGIRCFGKFVHDKRLTGKRDIRVSTSAGVVEVRMLSGSRVRVNMGAPIFSPADIPFISDSQQDTYRLDTNGQSVEVSAVSMGNPHAVMLVENCDDAPVAKLGALIERHEKFPNRVNVGFMQIVDSGHVNLRVFERGVGETRACGTGACAAVVAGRQRKLLDRAVDVALPGGQLRIEWQGGDAPVFMTGSATKVFEGKIRL